MCVISGAGGGMGADAAVRFSEEDARVCVSDASFEAAEQVAERARDAFPVRVNAVGAATPQISYTASKSAVLSLSKGAGRPFARQGVRVNALCPGPVETPLLLRV